MSQLPEDDRGNPIQILGYKHEQGAHTLTAAATSTKTTTAFDSQCRAIRVQPATDIYIGLGDSTITASSSGHVLRSGYIYDIPIKKFGYTHIAVLQVSAGGAVYISELY